MGRKEKPKTEEPFVLRSQDWDAPIIEPAKVGPALGALAPSAVLNCVVIADQKQIDAVQTILRGTTKAHKALLIYLRSEGKTRIPGKVGNQLAFRQGTIVQVRKSTTERCPQPVGLPQKGVAIKPIKMAVVYFKVPKVYLSEEGWKKFSSQPARAAAVWAASHHVALADSWGWVEEKPKGSKSGVQMFGLARLAIADITLLMAMSGRDQHVSHGVGEATRDRL